MTLFQQILVWLIAPNLFLWAWVWLVPTFVIRVQRIYAGALGLALPGLILLRRDVDESVLRHELQHVRQLRRYSPLGASLLLAWHYSVPAIRHRHRTGRWPSFWTLWQKNPLEIEANRAMRETKPLPRYWTVGKTFDLPSLNDTGLPT